jgi:hypothetical protein
VAAHEEESNEIVYFDPLADFQRINNDFGFLKKNAHLLSPEREIKIKYNSNAC